MKTLNDIAPGQTCKVTMVLGFGSLKRRIIDMGITPGAIITMKRFAPFGDPIQITIRGYELSIRKSEAENIKVESIERN